ncbi:DUF1048 domain-containing protein [Nocardia sp. XZ_19_231]|uniref:DUF1048 domain-containing protein n=1 Tax=Nocardia sp. XZ_19_231 TaxID=2769252 RepID=UPI00188FE5FF|nr:DUF1048 domain-containing protein [Nocardia sp. XZ_19_231]
MVKRWIEKVTGPFEDKRRYRQYKERVKQLPPSYRTTVEALDRYLMYRGAITNGDVLMEMAEDLADLFEQNAAAGVSVRAIVGEDPVEFAETFLANYSDGQWIDAERRRLTAAIERVEQEEGEGSR